MPGSSITASAERADFSRSVCAFLGGAADDSSDGASASASGVGGISQAGAKVLQV